MPVIINKILWSLKVPILIKWLRINIQVSHLVEAVMFLKKRFFCVSVIFAVPVIRLTGPSIWAYISPPSNQLDCPLTFISWIIYGHSDRGTTETLKETHTRTHRHAEHTESWRFFLHSEYCIRNRQSSAKSSVVLLQCCFLYLFISPHTHSTWNAKCATPLL